MSATTMALGSQPASMPAESNLDQMTHLISPARSELSEIDPSWEIRALADADGSIGTSSAEDVGAALCASPHTPVCAPPPDLPPVREAWQQPSITRVCNHSNRKGKSGAAFHSIVLHSHSHPALAQLTCSFIFLFSLFTLYFIFSLHFHLTG